MVRVIAGQAGGIRLKTPPGSSTRPTSDRVKEAMFNILSDVIPGANVLDLFSGCGALGIEALSRGAEHAVFVDSDRQCCRIIAANLTAAGCFGKARVICRDALNVLTNMKGRPFDALSRPFDLVLMDPPYHKGLAAEALRILFQPVSDSRADSRPDREAGPSLLSPDAWICIETAADEGLPEMPGFPALHTRRKYGNILLNFYICNDSSANV